MNVHAIVRLLELVKIQTEVQSKLSPQWMENDNNFMWQARKELTEAMEAIGPTPYSEWWKKTGSSKGQLVLEYIDTLVFSICDSVKREGVEAGFAEVLDGWSEAVKLLEESDDYFTMPEVIAINETIDALTYSDGGHYKYLFCLLLRNVGDIEGIYTWYLAKAVLNKFRNINGYKDGTYIKLWDGVNEDNHYLEEIIQQVTMDSEAMKSRESIETELMGKLEATYTNLTK